MWTCIWTCVRCGKEYKTWTGFSQHKCAREITDEVARAINEDDKDALREMAKAVLSDANANCNDDAH